MTSLGRTSHKKPITMSVVNAISSINFLSFCQLIVSPQKFGIKNSYLQMKSNQWYYGYGVQSSIFRAVNVMRLCPSLHLQQETNSWVQIMCTRNRALKVNNERISIYVYSFPWNRSNYTFQFAHSNTKKETRIIKMQGICNHKCVYRNIHIIHIRFHSKKLCTRVQQS